MLNWLFGDKKRTKAGQSDRAERNAVIRRIVSAAADSTNKREAHRATEQREAESQAIGPLLLTNAAVNPSDSGSIPQDSVAERAYEIWVRNGRPTGTAERDWQQAIVELASQFNPPIKPQPLTVS